MQFDASRIEFPPFSLERLMRTSFGPFAGERLCILIDLPDPTEVRDFAFLKNPRLSIQNYGHEVFYKGFRDGGLRTLGLSGGELFAYQATGGSNLDLPDRCLAVDGQELSLDRDIYPHYGLIICVSTYSATAPLTAKAKQFGFRGATMHGLNQVILETGLSVDYRQVSANAEKLRLGLTRADWFEIDFAVEGVKTTLRLDIGQQEAQKSHGLCPPGHPDVANLPAGEVYFVPTGGSGQFPFKYDEETLGLLTVEGGRVVSSRLIYGDYARVEEHLARLRDDPMVGALGELGFGTQVLPFSGRDIQDEKILGTIHIATGRDDHLGGHITPDLFRRPENATHDDVLFAPHKTPEIRIPEVRMRRGDVTTVVLHNYRPAQYLVDLLTREPELVAAEG